MLKLGLIGCGVIGERRAAHLPEDCKIVAVFDPNKDRAQRVSNLTGAQVFSSAAELIETTSLDGIMVAAINSALVPTLKLTDSKGLPVLVEKPAARSYGELLSLEPKNAAKIKIGFNHRFHPAYMDILNELNKNPLDSIMYIKAEYGNGARVGFDREWRAQVELSGGGELLDQGVHVLDLALNILNDLEVKTAWVRTHFWDMPVDDNAWAVLSTPRGQTFSMHVSSSEWKNTFRFEVYTKKRKYLWTGLGRSYGPEQLTIYTMKPEMGPPEVETKEYPIEDLSWLCENQNFAQVIKNQKPPFGGYADALRVLKRVEGIYQCSYGAQKGEPMKHPIWWSK